MLNNIDDRYCVRLICKICRDPVPNIIEDFAAGDLVCGDCGLVLGDRIIDPSTEWRTFADSGSDDPSRVGNPINEWGQGNQLDTFIGKGKSNTGMHKALAHSQARIYDRPADIALKRGYEKLDAITGRFEIDKSVVKTTMRLFKQIVESELYHSRNHDAIMSVCLLYAFRERRALRTFKEISAMTNVSLKDISRAGKLLKGKLENKPILISSKDLLERFCFRLGLDKKVLRISNILNENAVDLKNISGKNPSSVASACIYMASHLVGNGQNAKRIAQASSVSETTIKSTYKILYANRKELLTPEIITRCPGAAESNIITQ